MNIFDLNTTYPVNQGTGLVGNDGIVTNVKFITRKDFKKLNKDNANDLFVIACAIFDYNNKVVYTLNKCDSHTRLINLHNLPTKNEQIDPKKDNISGFITSGGYFFNRAAMAELTTSFNPWVLKPNVDSLCKSLSSMDIAWGEVFNRFQNSQKVSLNIASLTGSFPIFEGIPIINYVTYEEINEIKLIPYSNLSQINELNKNDFMPVSCAVFNYDYKLVYTFDNCTEHARLISWCDIHSSTEQCDVSKDIIYGFVTAGGYFFNRQAMAEICEQHFPWVWMSNIRTKEHMFSCSLDWIAINKAKLSLTVS